MRILVVDDNTELAENVAELLEDEGHEVLVAGSGADALRMVCDQAQCLDAALVDVRMEGMDGVELVEKLCQRCPRTVYVMMTAFSLDERLERARALGVTEILSKPFAPDALLHALHAA
ncbi:MAG: response regulator [Sandaracinus sp.]|nr:response regulator [Myxococcales bacterium]MCB9612390.1 response regulator [Sandaracinus sp.]MCB9624201.1 response regulator [Sandaracinus sp.]